MPKITIELNQEKHSEPSIEVDANDILWLSGKVYDPGCKVTLKRGVVLYSADDSLSIHAKINNAIKADNEPCRG